MMPINGSWKAQSTMVAFNKMRGNLYFFLSEYRIVSPRVKRNNMTSAENKMIMEFIQNGIVKRIVRRCGATSLREAAVK